MMRKIALAWLGLLALVAAATPAIAQCSAAISIAFGTVNVAEAGPFDSNGSVDITCAGLSADTTYRVCPGIGLNRQMTRAGGGTPMLFELYTDIQGGTVWGEAGGTPAPKAYLITTDGSGAAIFSSQTIYGRVPGNQSNVQTTSASKTFTGAPPVQVLAGDAGIYATCDDIPPQNVGGGVATMTATYEPSCALAVNALNFGPLPSTANGASASTTIQMTCTPETEYTITLSHGLNGGTAPEARIMTSGGDELFYGLYQDAAHAQPWGIAGASTTKAARARAVRKPTPSTGGLRRNRRRRRGPIPTLSWCRSIIEPGPTHQSAPNPVLRTC